MARLTKAQKKYRDLLRSISPYVEKSAFPAPSKASPWFRKKLERYASAIAELRGQPVYFYRARRTNRRNALKRAYGGSDLPALAGAFLPVQEFGDRATPIFRGDDVTRIVTRNKEQTVEREFAPIPLALLSPEERAAALSNEFSRMIDSGADNVRVAQGTYDSSFVVFPAEASPVENLVSYVDDLLEKYSETAPDGGPGPNDPTRWLQGLVSFRVLRGSEFIRPRRGGKARAQESGRSRRRR